MKIYRTDESDYEMQDNDIFCMARIGNSQKPSFSVWVNPDPGRVGDPYLKYFNSSDYHKADSVIRLGLKTPKIIIHRDNKKPWKVTRKELKQLDEFMSKLSEYRGITNWEYTIYHWNHEYGLLDKNQSDALDVYANMFEAFVDGFFDTPENLANPSYLPSYQRQIIYADELQGDISEMLEKKRFHMKIYKRGVEEDVIDGSTSLYCMANLKPRETGLPFELWVDEVGSDRKIDSDIPKFKPKANGVQLEIVLNSDGNAKITNVESQDIQKFQYSKEAIKFIETYRKPLLMHWDGEISSGELSYIIRLVVKKHCSIDDAIEEVVNGNY